MFDAWFLGIAGVAGAVGALASPVVFGALADSWFRGERLIALVNLGCAGMLALLSLATNQWVFLLGLLGYYQFCVPGVTLMQSVSLRHLRGDRHAFPVIRTGGTVGWILAMWWVGSVTPWWWGTESVAIESSAWPMRFAIIAHLVAAGCALTLPPSPPLGRAAGWRKLLDGCRSLLRSQPRLVRFLLVSFCATVPAQFYNLFANLYLNEIGVPHAASKLSLGQIVEIFCMLALPMLLLRWGPKRVFVVGLLAWVVRYLCLAFGAAQGWPLALVYVAILLHGVCYTFVYITAFIYVDHAATAGSRSASQGLLAMTTSGLGHLAGSLLTGLLQAQFLTPAGVTPAPYDWRSFFLVGAAAGGVALAAFGLLMGFHREVLPSEIDPDEAV